LGLSGYAQSVDKFLETEILVIGGGPAGCAAAIELVRSGRDVTIIDKANFPRDKCCGDGLTTDALRILESMGLKPSTVKNWNEIMNVVIHSPNGNTIELPLPQGRGQYAAIVPRTELDERLLDLARDAGTSIQTPVRFESLRELDQHVEVKTSTDRKILARYVIAADGMWSSVRKALGGGIKNYRGDWHAFRQYFSETGPEAQHLRVWFEPDLLPGYMWLFPLPGQRANIGFGVLRGSNYEIGDLGKLWNNLLERPHIRNVIGPNAVPEGNRKAWPIPSRLMDLLPSKGRIHFVGDAIGAADPMTGEGIAQALRTGRLSALAIIKSGPFKPQQAEAIYKKAISAELGHDHQFAGRLQKLLEKSETAELALQLANYNDWTRRNFARWMFEDYPRALALTPNRWSSNMFNLDGAYQQSSIKSTGPKEIPQIVIGTD
tara:strand:- start:808 stop:2109 length:1302 start_codon:yes stop_codon:yes gene_type:complete